MNETTAQLRSLWGKGAGAASDLDFSSHVKAIAHGRYVLRRILRLLDEQAISAGLKPLQHQALLQIFGADNPLPVSKVAERLDIAAALASRLIHDLEEKGLVERESVSSDRRIIAVKASPAGVEMLRTIDHSVHGKVAQFQSELTEEGKFGALATFSFYLGLDSDPRISVLLGGLAIHHHD
ncbi:MAG TPA: MarR family winged helix-turn-helix transcriptional regulator [Pseudonocardiaceae bacterium]|nr:MarR family winged helix-turn-helix transcriptional regulator [Pseudonocardiaceae bacterium]